jgi:quinol-cytochrome oxidoreductase complex cytochrome b subunit
VSDRDGWDRAVWITSGVLFFLVLVLAGTGLWLTTQYRPAASAFLGPAGVDSQVRRMHDVHVAVSRLAIAASVALLVTVIGRAASRRRGRISLVSGGVLVVVATLAASFTGFLLPWDQLGLWAVTVGTDIRGVWYAAWSGAVRFVILDNTEISRQTYQRWVLVHVVALGPVIVTLIAGILWRLRRRDDEEAVVRS